MGETTATLSSIVTADMISGVLNEIKANIIGAFIWLWLAWRVWLSIPGIIEGESGTWGDTGGIPDITFHAPHFQQGKNWLNSGSSYHGRGSGSKWKKDGD